MLFSKKIAIVLIAIFISLTLIISNIEINNFIPNFKLFFSFGLILLSICVFLFSHLKIELINYLKNSYSEVKKVVWPEKNEVFKITITIFIFVLIMSIFLWAIDTSLGWLVYDIILGWR